MVVEVWIFFIRFETSRINKKEKSTQDLVEGRKKVYVGLMLVLPNNEITLAYLLWRINSVVINANFSCMH